MTRYFLPAALLWSGVLAGCGPKGEMTEGTVRPEVETFANDSTLDTALKPNDAANVASSVFNGMHFLSEAFTIGSGDRAMGSGGDHFSGRAQARSFAGEALLVTALWQADGITRMQFQSNLKPQ